MKKIIGLILYIISLLITILWIYGIYDLIFNTCKNCPKIAQLIPLWQDNSKILFILGYPIITIILFMIGKKLRK